jgi:hypothetical protein
METIRNANCRQTKERMGRCHEGFEVAENLKLDKVHPK